MEWKARGVNIKMLKKKMLKIMLICPSCGKNIGINITKKKLKKMLGSLRR